MFYGVTNEKQIIEMVKKVCEVFGNGKNNNANKLLLGTIAVETNMATYRDSTPGRAGNSLCQHDRKPFESLQTRIVTEHPEWVKLAKDQFGIDLCRITWRMLEYAPLPAIIFARLKYKCVPAEIPPDLKGIAKYWKEYYNTYYGKGRVEDFIEKFNLYIGI